jgi:hypothetical protein
MKRREFFEKAGVGSAALITGFSATGAPTTGRKGSDSQEHEHHGGREEDVEGPLSSATVSFGQWNVDEPLDRFPNLNDRLRNNHQLIPFRVTIKAGGAVNFIISGLHHVLIYGNDTKPADINRTLTIPVTAPPGPPLINDGTNRVYRGLDPSLYPQDRVEVVRLANPGRYLAMCGVLPHFFDDALNDFLMYGFIRVVA